jgi:3-oxoadipate enol-lactonase
MRLAACTSALFAHLAGTTLPAQSTATAARPATPTPVAAAPSSLADAADRFVASGDVRIRYRAVGPATGEPVVLLHGFWGSLMDWRTIADSLARDHLVLALDARGMGQSSRFADEARYGAEMLDDIARVLDHAGVDRAHVVGFSMGAASAAGFALRHPTRVRSLVLAAGHYMDSTGFATRTASWVDGLAEGRGVSVMFRSVYLGVTDSAAAAVSERVMRTNDPLALMAVLRNFPAYVPPASATRITAPTIAIVGTADAFADETIGLARQWTGATLTTVPGVHHGGILRHPELLAAIRTQTARY